jgi:hypothetical protein
VLLVDSATCVAVDSAKVVIDSVTFSTTLTYSNAPTGNYYIFVFHRNHIPIASAFRYGIIRGSTVSYDFTDAASKTYGSNVIQVSNSPVLFGMIPGDANQDQYVDAIDQTIWIAQNGLDGYLSADFNGDLYVDAIDQAIWIAMNGQSSFLPCNIFILEPGMHYKKPVESRVEKKVNSWNVIPQNNQIEQNKQKSNKK